MTTLRNRRTKHKRSDHHKRSTKRSTKRSGKKYSPNCIVGTMTEMLHTTKLYHWHTHSYPEHKATDKLYEALDDQVDRFVETMLGSKRTRATLTHMPLRSFNTLPAFKRRIEYYKEYLKRMPASLGTDLLNIRDELLGSLNHFSYLLTLQSARGKHAAKRKTVIMEHE